MGHFEIPKTSDIPAEYFYWPHMQRDMERICNICIQCWIAKSSSLSHGLYTPLPILHSSWTDLSMDFILGLPRTQSSNDFIFVIVDRFSKISHFISYRKSNDAKHATDLFFQKLSDFMEFHKILFQIVMSSFSAISGRRYRGNSAPNCYFSQQGIPKPTDRQR